MKFSKRPGEIMEICDDCADLEECGELGFCRIQESLKIQKTDNVNHPTHYNSHPSGVECVDIAEFWTYNLGSALKYLWRVDMKGDPIENLRKSIWFIEREIERRQK